jgi:putative ABC transport system ATP-binding protein
MVSDSNRPIIELKDVWKVYRMGEVDVPALRGISLKIHRGEGVAIIGHSGSGKSTLLNMVGSLDTPTKGTVFLDGIDISALSESELAQLRGKKIGFVFQTFNLIPSMNSIENVELPMIFQGVPKEERRKRAIHLLKEVGLGHRLNNKPNQLSGGERQRVAIARALANDPEIILADEPTGNLDTKTGEEIEDLLCKLHANEGKTLILVTHEVEIAKHIETIIRLKDGKILEDGK